MCYGFNVVAQTEHCSTLPKATLCVRKFNWSSLAEGYMKLRNREVTGARVTLGWAWAVPIALILLAGCAAAPPAGKSAAADPPETMLVSYHVKLGKEAAFQDALARTWAVCRRDNLVFATPHLVVREKDDRGQTRFVESFTWVSHAAPDNAPPELKAVWRELESLCEPRDGKPGIDGNEVETVVHE